MGPGLSVLLGGRDRLEVQGTALGFSYSELSQIGCKEEPVVVAHTCHPSIQVVRQEDQEFKVLKKKARYQACSNIARISLGSRVLLIAI